MKIVVIAGGLSPERDVSLSSGALIANALMDNGHDVLLLDLYLGLNEPVHDSLFITRSAGKRFYCQVPAAEPDLARIKCESGNGDDLIGPNVLSICRLADVTFIALHGSIGEDGRLQAVFDTCGIRYTGTGYIGSLLAMDKDLAKKMMRQNGIRTPAWQVVDLRQNAACDTHPIACPCVVKPLSCGSSVGVTIVETMSELDQALAAARHFDESVLIEDKINGREFSAGILDGTALPVIEIIPKTGFYDYKNKYQAGMTAEICPAQLDAGKTLELQDLALSVHRVLRLGYYSRIDFIMDAGGEFYCLEANTLPGMTPTSLLPQEAQAAGISYSELCERIARAGYESKYS
jgi:D-alanine-D-alanine ligase